LGQEASFEPTIPPIDEHFALAPLPWAIM